MVVVLPGLDLLRIAVVDVDQHLHLSQARAVEQVVLLCLRQSDVSNLPQPKCPLRPPEREVLRVGEVVSERRLRVVGDRSGAVDEDPVALADHTRGGCHRHVDEGERRPIALRSAEVACSGVGASLVWVGGVREQELGRSEGVLVQRGHLVLLVGAATRGRIGASVGVGRHVQEAEIEAHPGHPHELWILGQFCQREQRTDVLEHVDVAVPLEEAEAGSLGHPRHDGGLGPCHVVGAGEAGDREGRRRECLARQELIDQTDDHVVLRPVPQIVDPPLGIWIVVAVPVVQHSLLDGAEQLWVQRRHRRGALTESEDPVQVHEAKVPRVLPRVDLLPHLRQTRNRGLVDRPGVVRVPVGGDQMHRDARGVIEVELRGGEAQVLGDAPLVGGLVDETRSPRDREGSRGRGRRSVSRRRTLAVLRVVRARSERDCSGQSDGTSQELPPVDACHRALLRS